MKLIIGLGNPGDQYARTRHNVGFMVVDKMADLHDVIFRLENQYEAENADFNLGEERVKLAKPQTYMNLSGQAATKLKNYYKMDTEDIVVIHDDVDLEFGKVKVQLGGSSAGHKGVQSIIDSIGTDQFWRVRVGVGRSDKIPTDDWVLKNFEKENMPKLEQIIAQISEEILSKLKETGNLSNQTYEI